MFQIMLLLSAHPQSPSFYKRAEAGLLAILPALTRCKPQSLPLRLMPTV